MDKDILKQTWKSIQDLYELFQLSRSQTVAGLTPLSRLKWIDGGTTAPAASQNGAAVGTPYSSFSAFLTAIGVGTSAADSQQPMVGMASPALAGYTENLTFPSRRNTVLKGQALALVGASSVITGNGTWANSAAGGGVLPTAFASVSLVDLVLSGNFTVTDDATTVGELFFTSTVFGAQSPALGGNLVATGATALAAANFTGTGVTGTLTSTATATGAVVNGISALFSGAIVAKSVVGVNSTYAGNITIAAGASGGNAAFIGCRFSGTPVITGGAGTVASFDGDSWYSFKETGGTLVTCIATAVGGYNGAPIPGAALSAANGINTNVTVSINGAGASAAFANGGNWYTVPTATLTGNRTVTLGVLGGEKAGDTILISRIDVSANTLTVINGGGGGGNVGILPVSVKGSILAAFDGTNWIYAGTAAAT